MCKTQALTSKILNYDGCSGKYGVYFPSDSKIVYIHPDDKDVVFLTWELSVHVPLLGLRTCIVSLHYSLDYHSSWLNNDPYSISLMWYDSSLLIVH